MFAFVADEEVCRGDAENEENYAEDELPHLKADAPRGVIGVDFGVVEHGDYGAERHARDGKERGGAALFQELGHAL